MISNWYLILLSSGNHIKFVWLLNSARVRKHFGNFPKNSCSDYDMMMHVLCMNLRKRLQGFKESQFTLKKSVYLSCSFLATLRFLLKTKIWGLGNDMLKCCASFHQFSVIASEVGWNEWQRHSLGQENKSCVYSGNSQHSVDSLSLVFIALPRSSQPCLLALTQIICS